MEYRKEVDGLRALAVLPVILFHAGFEFFSGGFVGVDIFFVISGYLITTIIVNEIQNSQFSIVRFYERRARRILPALFVVMIACIPLAWYLTLPSELAQFSQSLIAVSTFASNILFWRESGYFDTSTELKPLLHTWSLAVEEQFYLAFPVVLILASKKLRSGALPLVVAIGFIASFSAAQWASSAMPTAAFYLLPTRAWELLVGAAAAIYLARPSRPAISSRVRDGAGWLGAALIIFSIVAFSKRTPFPGVFALAPTLGAALLILFADRETTSGRTIGNPLFVGVGLISYSAYLWHQPLFAFARLNGADTETDGAQFLALTLLTLVLAYISWRFVELRFRTKTFLSSKQVFLLSCGGSALFVGLGAAGALTSGFPATRFTASQIATIATASSSPKRSECHFPQDKSALVREPCVHFLQPASAAVMGNSHATELAFATAQILKDVNIGVAQHTISGCNVEYHRPSSLGTVCSQWHEKSFERIASDNRIKYVILSYRNESSLAQVSYQESLSRLANDFRRAGKNVVLVLQAPPPKKHVNQYLRAALPDLSGDIPSRSLSDWRQVYSSSTALVRRLLPEVVVVDPADLFCDTTDCYVSRAGTAYYFDDNHMSVEGAKIVARRVAQHLFAQ